MTLLNENFHEPNVIRKKVVPIRPITPTRPEMMALVVIQQVDENKKVMLPTIIRVGNIPNYVESFQFAFDYGIAWVVAGYYSYEWSKYVEGA